MTLPIFQTALEQIKAEDWIAALSSLDRAIAQAPEFAEAYYHRGKIHAKRQNFPQAIADYTKVLQLQPTAEVALNRALLYLVMGETEAAIADAQQATQLDPTLGLAAEILGKAHRQLGNHAAAIAAYKQAAQSYLAQQDKNNAQACIQHIESLQPQVQPKANPAATQDFLQQAIAKIDQGKAVEARSDILWLLQFDPNHLEALSLLGLVSARLGNAQASVQAFAKALQLDPSDRTVRFRRSQARLHLGDAQGAVSDLTELMADEPANLELFLQRGHSHHNLEDWESAFKDYSNAISIRADHAEAYYYRAETARAMGDFKGANEDYQAAATHWFNQGNSANHHQAVTKVAELKAQLKQQAEQKAAAEAQIIRVPIKHRVMGIPVIEVLCNGQHLVEMLVDAGAGATVISPEIARILGIGSSGRNWGRVADGRYVEFESGWIRSLAVQSAIAYDLPVMIATQEVHNLLGHDFLGAYDVRVLSDAIELYRR
jgi:tetratricopeptide (TPR) repeat protein